MLFMLFVLIEQRHRLESGVLLSLLLDEGDAGRVAARLRARAPKMSVVFVAAASAASPC